MTPPPPGGLDPVNVFAAKVRALIDAHLGGIPAGIRLIIEASDRPSGHAILDSEAGQPLDPDETCTCLHSDLDHLHGPLYEVRREPWSCKRCACPEYLGVDVARANAAELAELRRIVRGTHQVLGRALGPDAEEQS